MANEKILIVDDDKNICDLLRLYLEKEGYRPFRPTTARPPWPPTPRTSPTWCCWT